MDKIVIALDGPSGAGKSSLAKQISKRLGIVYLDTGALYRTVGLYAKKMSADPHDEKAVEPLLGTLDIDVLIEDGVQQVYLNGECVGDAIRTPEMSMYASAVSALPSVRAFLLETQRGFARRSSVIMDGRDIGSVVLPDADVKIYLTASDEVRAMRRTKELLAKGQNVTFEEVLSDMKKRDHADSTRAVAPAIKPEDAVTLDNSELDEEGTVKRALEIIEEKTGRGSGQ
ncbi:MAG: (d)CMP kinase [Clostridia bacterium]|nr:(d)CMP kinase [Clostridia bacterium]